MGALIADNLMRSEHVYKLGFDTGVFLYINGVPPFFVFRRGPQVVLVHAPTKIRAVGDGLARRIERQRGGNVV